MKPPFTYFGGKTSIATQIAALLPAHEHYVEPFAGSLAVLLAKPPSPMETVNDLDGDLMNFWQILRDRPEDLERVCALTPHSRAEHLGCYDLATGDDLERARRIWIRLTQGRSGHLGHHSGWRYYQNARGSSSSMPDYLRAYVSRIPPAARRLAAVSLECKPAADVIALYGQHPSTLIYADPPYPAAVRNARAGRASGGQYGAEMLTGEQHAGLADALSAAAAAVVLSGYHSPLYDDLYRGWHRTEIRTFTGNASGDRSRLEVLWSNRPFHLAATLDLEEMQETPCASPSTPPTS